MPVPALPAWTERYADRRVFCCWGWRKTKAGKVTKPPLMPSGALASSTDPTTWVTLGEALTALGRGTMDGQPLAGIGIVLTEIEDLFAFDMDCCYNAPSGKLAPWAHELLAQLQTYSEVTPSGAGVCAIGTVPPMWHDPVHSDVKMDSNDGHVELFYRTERYITLTGDLLPGAPEDLTDVSQAAGRILTRLLSGRTRATIGTDAGNNVTPAREPDYPPPTPGDLQETLWNISPEIERAEWVRVAAALKHEGGDACRDMFLKWSATSETWGEENRAGNAEALWDSLEPRGSARYGTLIHLASTQPRAGVAPAKGDSRVPLTRDLWRELDTVSDGAARLFVELLYRFTGSNNGKIRLSYGEVMERFGWSHKTVKRHFAELHQAGLIKTTFRGRAFKGVCNLYWVKEGRGQK